MAAFGIQVFTPSRNDPIVDKDGRMTTRTARYMEILTNNVDELIGAPIPAQLMAMHFQLLNHIKKLEKRIQVLESA